MGLLELLKCGVGCEYISDMTFEPYNTLAKQFIRGVTLEGYTLHELSDVARYLYKTDISFNDIEEAKQFFIKHKKY